MISVIITTENIFQDKIIKINDRADINHLKNVFRVKIGEQIRAVDGKYEYFCIIKELDKKEIVLEIGQKLEDSYSTKVKIDAAIGVLKNDKMDLTIQKLTEIGISKIIPLATKRGVVKLNEKKEKWDLIVKESIKQCQRVKFLEIMDICKVENLRLQEYDLVIVPYECEEKDTLKNLLKTIEMKDIKSVLYIVGPEGGFEMEEIEFLKSKGAKIVTLGKRILRAETASIVVGGILINEFQ